MAHSCVLTCCAIVLAVFLIAIGLCVAQSPAGSSAPQSAQDIGPSLKRAYAGRFDVGAAIPAKLKDAEQQLLFRNFSTVTPENCMKPAPLHPAEDRFDFAAADALVEMASANGLKINGHTLVWHEQCPAWFFADAGKPASRDLVLKRMRAHIASVVGHFSGRMASWDVVNEAIALRDEDGYLRNTNWLTSIGDDYIAEAFIAAHQADPKAELFYNDFNIEQPKKREKALRLIRDLKARKAPINGIGIQGHWRIDQISFGDLEDAIIAFHAEGLKVAITELDLDVVKRKTASSDVGVKEQGADDPYASGLPAEVQAHLAEQYARLFALFLKHSDKIERVTFWGLHDGKSWLNSWPYKRTNHPLLWDRELQPKPALSAVLALP